MQLEIRKRNLLQGNLAFYDKSTLPENKVLIKSGPQSKKTRNFKKGFRQAS